MGEKGDELKMAKITIGEAFKEYDTIRIDYTWFSYCRHCRRTIKFIDEEYSFEGDKEWFEEKYMKDYPGVLDYDDEIEEIGKTEKDVLVYMFYVNDPDPCTCKECEEAEEDKLGNGWVPVE